MRNIVDKVIENRNVRLARMMREHIELDKDMVSTITREDFQ